MVVTTLVKKEEVERAKEIVDVEVPTQSKKIYLACPYSHPEKAWEEARVTLANLAAMALIQRGYIVFSPLSHSHPIAATQPETRNLHDLWLRQDLRFLEWADYLCVLTLPGWKQSYGVMMELQWAVKMKKMAFYLSLEHIWAIKEGQTIEGLIELQMLGQIPPERMHRA